MNSNTERKIEMFDFREQAKNATVISDLMEGRDKIKVSDIVDDEVLKGEIILTDFDIINTVNDKGEAISYPVFTYKEDDSKFFNGGYVLNKIVNMWIDKFDGNVDSCREAFRASGGLAIKMSAGKTKNSHNIINVEIK